MLKHLFIVVVDSFNNYEVSEGASYATVSKIELENSTRLPVVTLPHTATYVEAQQRSVVRAEIYRL